jgi:hypothetical protein
MKPLIASLAIVTVLALAFGVAWWFGRPRQIDDIDTETERMANLFAVEAMGEADWLANASGLSRKLTREMACIALNRAAMKLKGRPE